MTDATLAIVLLSASTLTLLTVVVWQWIGRRGGRSQESVRDLIRQMDRLATDVDRRMGGALADMQATISLADERIETLEDLLAQADETTTGDESSQPVEDDARAPEPRHEAPSPDPPSAPRPQNEAHQEILRLARDGMTPARIAEKLNRPVGEVDLILRLHGTAATPHAQQQAG